MKKFMTAIITVIMIYLMTATAWGANGDVAGTIYSTDIKACINGVWVDSYNIGGKTVVVVEDITNLYEYSDPLRTLIIKGFSPERLVSGKAAQNQSIGEPVGKIYETDIKTYFRGKELTAYSLDGKMAVVIEELGNDSEFSDIGGRYVWNPEERTICLESAYNYPYEIRTMMEDLRINMELKEADGVFNAELKTAPLWLCGYILSETEAEDSSMMEVVYNGEVLGYRCRFPEDKFDYDENGNPVFRNGEFQSPTDYFFVDKMKETLLAFETAPLTYQDWLEYFEKGALSTVKERFETDDYVFLYMFFSHSHGGTDALIKLDKHDGTKIDFSDNFKSVSLYEQKRFENVKTDTENEKVYLHYDVDYVIDLKTNKIEPLEDGAELFIKD